MSTKVAPRRVGIVEDPRYGDHVGPTGHPERPERLRAVDEAIAARREALRLVPSRPATPDEILRVHAREHLDHLTAAGERAPAQLDPDTYLGTRSLEVARLAAGSAGDLMRAVCRGELDAGLAAIRPPGHHAERDRAMGFCLLNNVAIAVRAVQAEEGVGRVLLFDWDVHHGNGTQHSFEADPSVLYASTHQYPFYPGTGDFSEAGVGAGAGTTLNVPLPAGCGDAEYGGAVAHAIAPAARAYRPELIVISCGFDAHREDPLAAMLVSGAGFRAMAEGMRALADDLCDGRIVLLLEGGYALSGLREGTEAVLDALLLDETDPPEPAPVVRGSILASVLEQVGNVHGEDFSALAAR